MLIFSLQNDRYTKFLALKKCRSQEEIQERMQTNVACILSCLLYYCVIKAFGHLVRSNFAGLDMGRLRLISIHW